MWVTSLVGNSMKVRTLPIALQSYACAWLGTGLNIERYGHPSITHSLLYGDLVAVNDSYNHGACLGLGAALDWLSSMTGQFIPLPVIVK